MVIVHDEGVAPVIPQDPWLGLWECSQCGRVEELERDESVFFLGSPSLWSPKYHRARTGLVTGRRTPERVTSVYCPTCRDNFTRWFRPGQKYHENADRLFPWY